MKNKHQRAVVDEIKRVGGVVTGTRWRGRGSHLIVYWELGAEKFFETISGSPSDPYATNNAMGQIRRRARQARSPHVLRLSA